MPTPVTQDQTVQAINDILVISVPAGLPIPDLDTNQLSDPAWSCNNFSPALLDKVCQIVEVDPVNLNTQEYAVDAQLPQGFNDQTFVNISMMGEPSALNHNFNILVSGGTTYLIQVFLDQAVNIVRRFENQVFIDHWHALSRSNNDNWAADYEALFGVAPAAVVAAPPAQTWLASQYVTQ